MQILTYLFSFYPGAEFNWFYHLLVFFVLTFIVSIIISFQIKRSKHSAFKKTFKKFPGHLQVLSIIGILLILMRLGGIGFFSMRALLFVLLAVLLGIIVNGIRKYFIILPKAAVQTVVKKEHNKYLPTAKKKKKKKRKRQ
jgi:hypothetical protein